MRFLFILDSYDKRPSANAVCVSKVASELLGMGHSVSLLIKRYGKNDPKFEIKNGLEIYRVFFGFEDRFYETKSYHFLHVLFSKIRFILHLFIWPVSSLRYSNKTLRLIKKIHKKRRFDVVVGVTLLVEFARTAMKFKESNEDVLFYLYTLDSLSGGFVNSLKKHKGFYTKRMLRWEKVLFDSADFIFAMEPHRHYYQSNLSNYSKYFGKIVYVDIPLYDIKNVENKGSLGADVTKKTIVYSGSMTYIKGEFIAKLLQSLPEYTFCFYGYYHRDYINQFTNFPNFHFYGLLEHSEIIRIQQRASFLLAFDNGVSSMIPGKIFEYFLSEKPIIYFSQFNECPFSSYLNEYGNYIYLDGSMTNETIQSLVRNYIPKRPRKSERILLKNQPIFTAEEFANKYRGQ